MNSKERVSWAINFGRPDRVPISHAVLPVAQIKYGQVLFEILEKADEDFGWNVLPNLKREGFSAPHRKGKKYDGFNTLWHPVNAMAQARDYMLAPAQKDLQPGETFTARIRHIIADINDTKDLEPHWNRFMEDLH